MSAKPEGEPGFEPRHLCCAVEDGNVARVQQLLAAGADPNCHWKGVNPTWGPFDHVPLHCVARRPEGVSADDIMAIVRLLLEKGADPNIKNVHGQTALHLAVVRGREDVAAALLEGGADPDTADNEGTTVLENVEITALIKTGSSRRRFRKLLRRYLGSTPREWRSWGYRDEGLRCPYCGVQSDFESGVALFSIPAGTDLLAGMRDARAMAKAPRDRTCPACQERFQSRWAEEKDASRDFYEWRPAPKAKPQAGPRACDKTVGEPEKPCLPPGAPTRSDGDKVRFPCPDCRRMNVAPRAWAGKKGRCPACKNVISIPTV